MSKLWKSYFSQLVTDIEKLNNYKLGTDKIPAQLIQAANENCIH
jgi:hypothetical protein